jgi:hypothetical protein
MIGRSDLIWRGLEVRYKGRKMAEVMRDKKYPEMYRIDYLDGEKSDMVNLSRAKDAALGWVLSCLNADRRAPKPH